MTRISSINAIQAGKVASLLYLIFSLVICVPAFLFTLAAGSLVQEQGALGAMSAFFWLAMPFVYGILGFVGTAILASIYNLVARLVGGIEMTFVAPQQDAEPRLNRIFEGIK